MTVLHFALLLLKAIYHHSQLYGTAASIMGRCSWKRLVLTTAFAYEKVAGIWPLPTWSFTGGAIGKRERDCRESQWFVWLLCSFPMFWKHGILWFQFWGSILPLALFSAIGNHERTSRTSLFVLLIVRFGWSWREPAVWPKVYSFIYPKQDEVRNQQVLGKKPSTTKKRWVPSMESEQKSSKIRSNVVF